MTIRVWRGLASQARFGWGSGIGIVLVMLTAMLPATSGAQEATRLALELNKLEPGEKACRAYVVVDNTTPLSYDALKLDLVLFRSDGIIGRRFAVELAPVRPTKRTVKLFDLDGIACDDVGSLLVNDVIDCKVASAPATDCMSRLELSSLAKAKLSK